MPNSNYLNSLNFITNTSNMTEQSIPCPNCGNQISFDVQQLLSGAKFKCPNCQAEIGLSNESTEAAKNSFDQFEKLKKNK